MDKQLKFQLEGVWWLLTAVVIGGILYPIVNAKLHYPFLWTNILFIVVFITLARYIFLLKYTWLARLQRVKLVLIFLSIPFIFFLVSKLNGFQAYLDDYGLESLFEDASLTHVNSMTKYIRTEMLLFGVGSIVAAIIFPFRMLISIWRTRNRGTV